MRSATLQDLADELGVARSTVSRALRDDEQISPTTRRRVQHLASERGYHPNAAARALNRRATGVLGAVLPRSAEFVFANPYFTELLAGIARRAERASYPLMLSASPTPAYTLWLKEGRVDGLIALGDALDERQRSELEHLGSTGATIVLIGRPARETPLPVVAADEEPGIEAAAERAASLGHRHAVVIAGPVNAPYASARTERWRRALERTGIVVDATMHGDDTSAGGAAAAAALVANGRRASLWCVGNDQMAIGALRTLAARGVTVPDEVSIVGFDDAGPADLVGLSTIHQPCRELGGHAVERLVAAVTGSSVDARAFTTSFVERRTLGPAPEVRP